MRYKYLCTRIRINGDYYPCFCYVEEESMRAKFTRDVKDLGFATFSICGSIHERHEPNVLREFANQHQIGVIAIKDCFYTGKMILPVIKEEIKTTGEFKIEYLNLTPGYEVREEIGPIINCRMPDPEISINDMETFGYGFYSNNQMLPIGPGRIEHFYYENLPLFMLYNDDTEAMVENSPWKDIERHVNNENGGLFGIEKEDWIKYLESRGEWVLLPLPNKGTDIKKNATQKKERRTDGLQLYMPQFFESPNIFR